MAQRRMFSLKIVDTDEFLDMPQTSQLLYFHLAMRADDDGFVSNPKKISKIISSGDDDMKVLIMKRFIVPFERGVCVIRHWHIHNLIRADRYTETEYLKEKNQLKKINGKYEEKDNVIPDGNHLAPQVRIGEDSIGEDREISPSQKTKEFFLNENGIQRKAVDYLNERGVSDELASRELSKFTAYWTEPNHSGTKQRWQLQKTFDVKRRLNTWFGNIKSFNQEKSKGRGLA